MESKYKHIYFLGIGGIGMSALAQYFQKNGYQVAGYDRTNSTICKNLIKLGVSIHFKDDIQLIPESFKTRDNTLVVLTPAIPQDNSELAFFTDNCFKISKRAEILGLISNDKTGIAIAGTHGKTSVSTIASWVISQSQKGCNAFLGGISKNIESNLLIDTDSDLVVVEADEFDRSFHQLTPSTALITSLEADHLDIYKDLSNVKQAFFEFGEKLKQNGKLILNEKVDKSIFTDTRQDIHIFTYGIDQPENDFYANNIVYKNDKCYFDIHHPMGSIKDIEYSTGGNHNIENALAATAVSLINYVRGYEIKEGLRTFKGVVRRFDIQLKSENLIYIDDYAHHPSEIKAFLSAVKQIYPNRKITAIFQPHLFSRTKDFYLEFAESLSLADDLLLLPIYPAREKPIKGISSKIILEKVKHENKQLIEKKNLISILKSKEPEIIVTMGAGDIDQFVSQIKKEFS